MTGIRRIDAAQRRARLALRHHLAPEARAQTAAEVAGDLVGLHGTDPASVFLAAQARVHGWPPPEAIADEMYTQRALMRMLGMRRTVFVVATSFAPVMQAACTDEIARRQRRRYADLLAQGGIPDADEPRLRQQVMLAEGKSYGGMQGVGTWVLTLLAADGRIVRGRPRGSWTSSQFRWLPIEEWLPAGLERPPASAARTELLRRWLAVSGPATADDLRWWTGWTAGQVTAAAAEAGVAEVDLGGSTGLVLAGDGGPVPVPAPWAALLPALDPTVMGWRAREWFLGPHGPALTDRSGNIGPTVWWDGRVVGGWAQRPDGEIVYRLLEDVGAEALRAVEEDAERLRVWISPARVTPRFRTPLERELSA